MQSPPRGVVGLVECIDVFSGCSRSARYLRVPEPFVAIRLLCKRCFQKNYVETKGADTFSIRELAQAVSTRLGALIPSLLCIAGRFIRSDALTMCSAPHLENLGTSRVSDRSSTIALQSAKGARVEVPGT